MSDSSVTSDNRNPADAWLATVATMDRTTALAFLGESARATVASLETLAGAALAEVENDLTRADGWLQLASDLRALLTTTNEESDAEESDAEESNVNDAGGAIPAAVDAQLAYATARLAVHQGQLERAERTLRQAQAHWGRANDQRGATRTLLGLTQVLAMQGRYDEAEAAARQAVAAFAASPTAATFSAEGQTGPVDWSAFSGSLLRAGAHHNLATLLLYTERHAAALAEYDRALQLLSTYNDATLTAEAQRSWLLEVAHNELNRAGALTFLDRPEEAEAALLRAAGAFTQAEDRTNHGRVQTNLGRLYLRGGHYAAALAAFDRAVRDLLDDEVAELLVTTPAVDLAAEGRSGEEAATLADALLRQADELLLEQATAYLVMNLLPEAEQRLTHCEVLFRTAAQPYELGQTLYTRGILRLRTADFADAAHNLAEAAGQFAQLNNHFWRNRTALAQAALHFATGDASSAAEALDALIAALPAQEANGEGAALQWDLGGLLELYLLRLRVAVVGDSLVGATQWAEEIADLLDLSLPALQAQAAAVDPSTATEQSVAEEAVALPHYTQRFYHLLGQWARARGAPLEARYYFQRAIALLERTRALLPVEEIRTAFLDDKGELYADLILLLLEQADADPTAVADAFAAVERARSRALLERLLAAVNEEEVQSAEAEGGQLEGGQAESPHESQSTLLRNRLHWLYNQLLGESGSRRLDGRLSAQLLAEEATLKRFEWQKSTFLQQAEPADLAAFQAALGADQQAIIYVILNASQYEQVRTPTPLVSRDDSEVMAFVIDKISITPHRHLTTAAQLAPLLDELRFQLGRAELGTAFLARHQARLHTRLQSVLGELYQQLVAPLRADLHCRRLLIVPYGPLHRLPFHALWDGGQFLLQWATISYAPSASTVVVRRRAGTATSPSFTATQTRWAGIAIADAAIPAARAEVAAAARCFATAQLYVDGDAGRAGLERAAQADILHLATHGLFRPDNPFFSALKLADGWINVRELYHLALRSQLVVLSACESGAGVVRGGDEVVGLVRGFLGAGAREVLASLWNVHDETAVEFMRHFYLALTNGDGIRPADALRAAQCWAIGEGLHPYYWAPFYVIGE